MNPRLASHIMLSDAQTRLLRALAEFPATLEKAWDVPRGLSLPGLSEKLGVVRSALNPPITSMEKGGLVFTRKAHVIGGGHRKRTVVHLTEEGRRVADALEPEEPSESGGELRGNAPPYTHLWGRDELLSEICENLSKDSCSQLIGLPGIGKTSLLRSVAEEVLSRGWDVAWATADRFTDLTSLSRDLLGAEEGLHDVAAAVSMVEGAAGKSAGLMLVVDELQAVHSRHREQIVSFLTALGESDEVALCIGCRAPSPIDTGRIFMIEELEAEDALLLLPDKLSEETGRAVVEALGGHPLALKLWQPGHSLPEADDRIQEFIKSDIVDGLTDETVATLDELAASPLPLLVDQMANQDGICDLDEGALLRWAEESTELQHLVRNVRRAMWSDEEATAIHKAASRHWSERIEPEARIHSIHHLVESCGAGDEKSIESKLSDGLDEMLTIDSAAVAAILSTALFKLPDANRLKLLAAKVAIERGEGEIAEDILMDCTEFDEEVDFRLLHARVKRLKGDFDGAESDEKELLEEIDVSRAVKLRLNRLVLALEDRLPAPLPTSVASKVKAELENLQLEELTADERKAALVTIAAIKHKLALEKGDAEAAARIRTDLAFLTVRTDPIIEELAARAALRFGGDSGRVKSLVSRTTNPLRRCALALLIIAHSHEAKEGELLTLVNQCEHPPNMGTTTARRLSAMLWYWRGVADPGQRVRCWQEALYRFGMAECANAYIQLQHKLHDVIR